MQSQRLIQHTGSAELTIEGKNLKDTLRLLHDGVEYTPLTSTDDSVTFILGDNGTNRIYVNGEYSFGVQISGVVVPNLSQNKRMVQLPPDTWTWGNGINEEKATANCINYPHIASDSYPRVKLAIFNVTEQPLESDFACVNGVLGGYTYTEPNSSMAIGAEVTDRSKPAYITYQGFIIAVFNYE